MKIFFVLFVFAVSAYAQGPSYPYNTNLTWTDSSSPNIASQSVYRSPFTTVCGSFSKIASGLSATATAYQDANPPEGQYCYATTATNKAGTESGLSTPVTGLNIPPPPQTNLNGVVSGLQIKGEWQQAKSGIDYDKFGCGPKPGDYVHWVQSQKPVNSLTWTAQASGIKYCVAAAFSKKFGESAYAGPIKVTLK